MSDDSGIASHGARGESVRGPSAYRFGSVQSRVPTGAGELMPPLLSCEQWPGNAAAATPDSRLLWCAGPGTSQDGTRLIRNICGRRWKVPQNAIGPRKRS